MGAYRKHICIWWDKKDGTGYWLDWGMLRIFGPFATYDEAYEKAWTQYGREM